MCLTSLWAWHLKGQVGFTLSFQYNNPSTNLNTCRSIPVLFSQVQSLTLALKPWEVQYNASIYYLYSSTSQSPYIFRFTHHHLNRSSFISYQPTSYPLFTVYLVKLSTWSKSRQGSVFSTASPDARFIASELYSFSLLQNGFPYPSFRMSGFLATTDLPSNI